MEVHKSNMSNFMQKEMWVRRENYSKIKQPERKIILVMTFDNVLQEGIYKNIGFRYKMNKLFLRSL